MERPRRRRRARGARRRAAAGTSMISISWCATAFFAGATCLRTGAALVFGGATTTTGVWMTGGRRVGRGRHGGLPGRHATGVLAERLRPSRVDRRRVGRRCAAARPDRAPGRPAWAAAGPRRAATASEERYP